MIPTIRSMLAAMLLTVTVLIGGFGLFAAFRVNHEPLARLPVAATQFQFASIDSAPRPFSFASDPPHLESNEALRAVVTAISAHDPDQAEVAAPPVVSSDKATDNAAPERVATGSVPPGMAAAQPPNNPDSSSAPADAVAAAAPPETAPPQMTNVAAVTAAETEQPQTAQASAPAAEVTPPATAIAAAQPPEPSKPDAATDVTGSITEMPPQEAVAPATASQATLAEPPETARQIANRKRLAALRRARKARAAALAQAANQTSGFGQANFPSGSGFQSALVSLPTAARRPN